MAKVAKKPAAKKATAKPAVKAKPEKKGVAPKPEAPAKKEVKKEVKKDAPVKVQEPAAVVAAAAPVAKAVKKEKPAVKSAAEKALSEDVKKWVDYREKFGSEKAASYNMSATYEPMKPILHKVLGWGYILSVQNDRLEVLFESGPKMLISNYKPS